MHLEVTAGLIVTIQELVVSLSVELITDAAVTDGSVTGVDNATVHTGLLASVVNIDV